DKWHFVCLKCRSVGKPYGASVLLLADSNLTPHSTFLKPRFEPEFAEKIIAETHTYWEALMQRADTSPLNCSTVTLEGNAHQISDDEANSIVASTPEFGPDAGREAI
ncbi:putative secreted inorganic pyrophosphatase, partial [Ixodes scapularis]